MWARCGIHKKCVGSYYAEVVFLHPMRYVNHVEYYGASGAQNVDTLFCVLVWA
jgi:hypothetical protein